MARPFASLITLAIGIGCMVTAWAVMSYSENPRLDLSIQYGSAPAASPTLKATFANAGTSDLTVDFNSMYVFLRPSTIGTDTYILHFRNDPELGPSRGRTLAPAGTYVMDWLYPYLYRLPAGTVRILAEYENATGDGVVWRGRIRSEPLLLRVEP